MGIESEVVESKENDKIDYPCLMVSMDERSIVLMSEYGWGSIVYTKNNFSLGSCQSGWEMNNFKVFDGQVVLSNKKG